MSKVKRGNVVTRNQDLVIGKNPAGRGFATSRTGSWLSSANKLFGFELKDFREVCEVRYETFLMLGET